MQKKKLNLSIKILIGLALGIVAGLFLPADFATAVVKPFGTLFLNLIKMVVVPLVFASIVVGTCGLNDAKSLGRLGGKTIIYYLFTTALAVTIGLAAANLFPVGRNLAFQMEAVSGAEPTSVVDTLLNIVPTNPIKALAEGNMLPGHLFRHRPGHRHPPVRRKGTAPLPRDQLSGGSDVLPYRRHHEAGSHRGLRAGGPRGGDQRPKEPAAYAGGHSHRLWGLPLSHAGGLFGQRGQASPISARSVSLKRLCPP